jgi:alkyldihydroxyacetonephosphate synthase
MQNWILSLRQEFGPSRVIDGSDELDAHSLDRWPVAIKLGQQGRRPYRPEVIFRPVEEGEVSRLLAWASRAEVPVTPWGAGSGVVGAALPVNGGILLDLSELRGILMLDEGNLYVQVRAGMIGSQLEAELNARGYTLNHSPQSLDRSTVGGWVSTRATGQFSSRWGGIEDLILAVTVVLPDGEVVTTRLAPRAAEGPELRELFIGSEGTLGVILNVVLKIFPLPERRILETIAYPSVQAGLDALRRLARSGLRPFLARLYDVDESRYLRPGHLESGGQNLLLVGFEGLERVAQAEYQAGLELLMMEAGTRLGPEVAQRWMERRFDFSAIENRLARPDGLAETIEVADFWDGIGTTYAALKANLAPLADEVLGHFSHLYPQGISLYMILLGEAVHPAAAEERLRQIWEAAMRTSLEAGAVISHHHGIGLARGPYLKEELDTSWLLLERIKLALDPLGILNPGKLGFEPEER